MELEKNGQEQGGGTTTIDELLEELSQGANWNYRLLVLSLMVVWLGSPPITYLTQFAGLDPTTADKWSCLSLKCDELALTYDNSSDTLFPCTTVTEKITGEVTLALEHEVDYQWDLERTSFAADFDIVCNVGSRRARKTLVSSIFFAGALCGLIVGGYLFDNMGRRRSVLGASLLAVVITFLATFCKHYSFLLVIRFLQGFSIFIVVQGMYILTQELLPTRHRNYVNSWSMCMWALGYPVVSGLGYFIKDWHYMYLAASLVLLLSYIPVLFAIESPRFYLLNNDTEAAKESLASLARLSGVDLELKGLVLGEAQEREQSLVQQLKEFYQYPILTVETGIQMFFWFVVAMSYYGFNFGWGSIVPDQYLAYLMAMVGELIAYVGLVPLVSFVGRRRAMILLFVLAAGVYLVLIPDVPLTSDPDGWTLESLAALVGIVFVSAAFSLAYLYTGELAPTSHRGLVYGMSSGSARIGSFLGPFIFNNMFDVMEKWEPLSLLALLALLSALGSFALIETENQKITATPGEVAERRKDYQFRI